MSQHRWNNGINESSVCAVQQYEDAVKQYKAGKPVDFDELPCPPGKFSLLYDMLLLYTEN